MNRVRQLLTYAVMLIGLMSAQAVFACSQLPIWFLHTTTTLDRKLPLTRPTYTYGGTSCAQVFWPSTFNSLSDADILKYLGNTETGSATSSGTVPTATFTLAPAWDVTKVYLAGNLASYGGSNYKARWWTQGDMPSPTSSVWEQQADAYGNPPAWQPTVGYPLSSQVSYQGNIYSAKWWSQNEIPGAVGTAWVLVGPMVQPVLKRPATFQARVTQSTTTPGAYTGTWSTGDFSSANYAVADTWQVRVNGIVVQQSTPTTALYPGCSGATPCTSITAQSGSFSFTVGYLDQFSLWLCAKNVCRPSSRVTIMSNTIDEPVFSK